MTISPKEIDIDATPIVYLPIGNLYRAFSQLPRGTSGFDLMGTVVRFVAHRLLLQAELHATGASIIRPLMDPAQAGERSRELLRLVEALEVRADGS